MSDPLMVTVLHELGLDDLAQDFSRAKIRKLTDLGADAETASQNVERLVPAAYPDARRIMLEWWSEAMKPEPKPEPKPLPLNEIPSLPEGEKLDLTHSTVTIDDVTYKIPDQLSVRATAATFGPVDWVILAHKTKLLYGVDLERALESAADDGARAPHAALVWKVPSSDDFADTNTRGTVDSSMCYSSNLSNLVHNRIVTGSVSVATPFVSASARVMRDEKQASSSLTRSLYMTGMWRYTQARLTLRECTAASPAFLAAIAAALAAPSDKQFAALDACFTSFGHVVPETVTVGGQLFFQSQREVTGKIDENQVRTTVQAAVTGKVNGFGGGASASFADGTGQTVSAQDIAESVSFDCVGGDTLLASNPAEWAGTVKDPNNWAVIARQGMVPLVDWLDPVDKEKVLRIWTEGLRQIWGGHTPPQDYLMPDFDNRPFTLVSPSQSMAMSYAAEGADWRKQPFEFVTGVPASRLSGDLVGARLLWRAVYSGATTQPNLRGKPLYWIVAYPQDRPALNGGMVVLATAGVVDDAHPAVMVDRAVMAGTSPDLRAQWTVTPVNPSGFSSQSAGAVYLIQNAETGMVLDNVDPLHSNKVTLGPPPGDDASAIAKVGWTATPVDVDPAALRTDILRAGDALRPDQAVLSADGKTRFEYQGDGNLVLYGPSGPLWASRTEHSSAGRCMMQWDGNLVVYDADHHPVWSSETDGNRDAVLYVGNDGTAVIRAADGRVLWPRSRTR